MLDHVQAVDGGGAGAGNGGGVEETGGLEDCLTAPAGVVDGLGGGALARDSALAHVREGDRRGGGRSCEGGAEIVGLDGRMAMSADGSGGMAETGRGRSVVRGSDGSRGLAVLRGKLRCRLPVDPCRRTRGPRERGGEKAIGGGDGFWRERRWFDWEIEGGHGDSGNLERGEIDEGG
ncbi:uncharacterized protein A4U43_C04F30110 [Asparagus officinalis]|uniref:Uncharacterized protein n=1 Tax=Asparagus officinalis TaxID=4686 RepID=A0A5P1F7G1_ASPOF|nr:uncharacterized protein A4U43_C04F30110 [Asparagus officinalis]